MGGGAGPRSAGLAARWADKYDVVYRDPEQTKQRMERISAACEAIGRDPATVRRSLLTKTIVGTDENEVRRRATELMEWEAYEGDPDAYLADASSDASSGRPSRF